VDETTQLLAKWRDGEEGALPRVLDLHLAYVRERARQLLGPGLRAKLTSEDVAHDAVVEFLRYGPKFVPKNGKQFRTLLARIVANTVADHGNWFRAARRRMSDETTLERADGLAGSTASHDPAQQAARRELAVRLRLAMELIPLRDRQQLIWREWEQRPYAEIAELRGVSEEAARSGVRRAVTRLRDVMARLRRGELDELLDAPLEVDEVAPGEPPPERSV